MLLRNHSIYINFYYSSYYFLFYVFTHFLISKVTKNEFGISGSIAHPVGKLLQVYQADFVLSSQ